MLLTPEGRTTLVDNSCKEETVQIFEHLISDEDITAGRLPAVQEQFAVGYHRRVEEQRRILERNRNGMRYRRRLREQGPPPLLTATADVALNNEERASTIRLLRRCLPYRQYRRRAANGVGWEMHFKFRLFHHVPGSREVLVWKIRRCPHCGLIMHRDINGAMNILEVGVAISCTPPYQRPAPFQAHHHHAQE